MNSNRVNILKLTNKPKLPPICENKSSIDVLGDSSAGVMNEDLRTACLQALKIPREVARTHAEKFSWRAASEQFANHLKPVQLKLSAQTVPA